MPATSEPSSLRAEQVAQTRAALVAAGRRLFGENGFRGTSVEDLAREARVTTGALYHHFPTKTALFEAVFVQAHMELMAASLEAAKDAGTVSTSWRWVSTHFSTGCFSPMCSGSWCWTVPRCSVSPATPNWTSSTPTR